MTLLRPAGLITRFFTSLFPTRLEVELLTFPLPDGTVEVVPNYLIGGQLVPPEFVSAAKTQIILGHTVTPAADAIQVHREIGNEPRRLSKRHAGTILGRLSQKGVRLRSKTKGTSPTIGVVKPELGLQLGSDDSLRVTSRLTTAHGIIVEKPTNLEDLKKDGGWYVSGSDLYSVELIEDSFDSVIFGTEESVVLRGDDVPRFLQNSQRHESAFETIERNQLLESLAVYGGKPQHQLRVDGDKEAIRLNPSLVFLDKNGKPCQSTAEDIDRAVEKGGGFSRIPEGWVAIEPDIVSSYRDSIDELKCLAGNVDEIRGEAIPETLAALVDSTTLSTPWVVYFSKEVKDSHRVISTPSDTRFTLNIVESDGKSLLELDPRYNHDRFRLSQAQVAQAVEEDKRWVRRDSAWIKIDRQRYDQITSTVAKLGLETTTSGVRFAASRREEILRIFSRIGSIEHGESYSDFLTKLADFEKIEHTALPASLRSQIQFRTYQQHGYNWLAFLQRFGLNGVLADDMGLGKTLQTLAVIRREQEQSNSSLPSLVVCPTSVVANWKREAAKFFDGIQVRTYTGSNRQGILEEIRSGIPNIFGGPELSNTNHQRHMLVITSFDIARRDRDDLSQIPWLYVVVDEAHHIKNPSAQRTRAIKTINGQYKLALTGTPIQNNLEELWSIFDFVMPGYLGARAKFRSTYGNGQRVDWSAVHNEKTGLRKRIHPFVLRRLKEHVAKDLPDKVVISQPVELSPLQVQLYKETLASKEFKQLEEAVENKGVNRSGTEILAIYTRLRNICNHPALASGTQDVHVRLKDSGKLAALHELIEEVKEGGHRALVFCQSTKMLDIIMAFFKRWGIEHLRLDGSTAPSTRQDLVDEFNREKSNTAFLISTKAGGTGLNLTGADTVIFYDHDWNPANDNQAQDRAHRIGQTKKVTVYKLVSAGTIEEKIIERQDLKQTFADQIIGSDGDGFKDLSKEQLLSLFQYRV